MKNHVIRRFLGGLMLSGALLFSACLHAQDSTALQTQETGVQPFAGDTTLPAAPVLQKESQADTTVVYSFDIRQEVGPALWRIVQKSLKEALDCDADVVLIQMNTYGGQLDAADSIRTSLLNFPRPVYVFVDNNAISAGALITLAADKVYMREGAAYGAATVVNQTGAALPDKYQSFMRALMRSTAESHGRDMHVSGTDTTYVWHRDPLIAEAMVDARTVVEGLVDSTRVLTLTTEEALRLGYCDGKAERADDVLRAEGIETYTMQRFTLTPMERVIGWLVNPMLQGLLIMAMLGGIYFEFKAPGTVFPLCIAALAALCYFAPLYLEGLAAHWEMLLFAAGVVLLALELFVIPGFGVAGVSGILCMLAGLVLSMVDNVVFSWDFSYAASVLLRQTALVMVSCAATFLMLLWLGPRFLQRTTLQGVALRAEQASGDGYVSGLLPEDLKGKTGTALTMLRPSGRVLVDGNVYDAVIRRGYAEKGDTVKVVSSEAGQLVVTNLR